MAHRETRPRKAATPVRERSRSPTPAIRAGTAVAPYICPLCRLQFSTQRARCGHMNAHNNRGWRGMVPPPGLRIEDFIEYEIESDEAQSNFTGPVNEAATGEGEEGVQPMLVDEQKPSIPDLNKSPPAE